MARERAPRAPEWTGGRAADTAAEALGLLPPPQPRLTPAERVAEGKLARADVPRSAHAEWKPAPDRPDPIGVLEQQARTRDPVLVPIRYERMLASPLAFFRGGAAVMANDLAALPRTRLRTQLSGDAHLANFGLFAAPDRRLVFSPNDFDETLPGPFEWDVKRLAASFVVAGRHNGFSERQRRGVVLAGLREYRGAMRSFASLPALDVWYVRLDVAAIAQRWESQASSKAAVAFEKTVAMAKTRDRQRALAKLTHIVDGEPRIVSDPPLIVPIEELMGEVDQDQLRETVRAAIRSYRRTLPHDRRRLLERYRYAHMARKVVGVGSVGMRVWIVLLLGTDHRDPLFLQLKEAQPSVLEPFVGKSAFANHGQRVVEGQRLMQAASDIMLGWDRIDWTDGEKRDFYVRQLWDAKTSLPIELMDAKGMTIYAQMCGWTLANAHARAGDAIAISSYLGTSATFDGAIAAFAEAYADQNERDYGTLRAAAADGRVLARIGL